MPTNKDCCNCGLCAMSAIKQDPGYFEGEPEEQETPRFMGSSSLWNDGANVPPGVREDEL